MLQKFFLIDDINGVAWTLQIELAFYMLCATLFTVGALRSYKQNLIVIGGFLIVALLFAILRQQTGFAAPIAMPLGLVLMFGGYLWR